MMIATSLVVMGVGMLFLLSEGTGRSLLSITTQSSYNQLAATSAETILARIRLANFASNDIYGNVLTLSFDDDPDVDSNGDRITWNDQDHFEQFLYVAQTNLADSYIAYRSDTRTTVTNVIIPNGVRQLAGRSIFEVTNNLVRVHFGLVATNATPLSQAIEIRTKATLRNKRE
jgi:hypothetical protein